MARALVLVGILFLAACGGTSSEDLTGAELFIELGCQACHTGTNTDVAPTLEGVWGSEVLLSDGRTVVADEEYVRRAITEPGVEIVDGFDARMPVFSLTDSEVDRLVDYVRSLG